MRYRPFRFAFAALLLLAVSICRAASPPVRIWEMHELTFQAASKFGNPYTDATMWIDLSGPGFNKRVYGFWDGGKTFKVRVLATSPGTWTWKSGSEPNDSGLSGKQGSFAAVEWTDAEKQTNFLRRGYPH